MIGPMKMIYDRIWLMLHWINKWTTQFSSLFYLFIFFISFWPVRRWAAPIKKRKIINKTKRGKKEEAENKKEKKIQINGKETETCPPSDNTLIYSSQNCVSALFFFSSFYSYFRPWKMLIISGGSFYLLLFKSFFIPLMFIEFISPADAAIIWDDSDSSGSATRFQCGNLQSRHPFWAIDSSLLALGC